MFDRPTCLAILHYIAIAPVLSKKNNTYCLAIQYKYTR